MFNVDEYSATNFFNGVLPDWVFCMVMKHGVLLKIVVLRT